MRASKLQPALLGGLVIGVLSALPVISMGNCLCCLWVILGGIVATYLLQQSQSSAVDIADGAIVGLLAGVIGVVVSTVLSIPIQWLMGSMGNDTLQRVLNQSGGDMPPEARAVLEQLGRNGVGGAMMLAGLLIGLVVYSIAGALGGMLGTVMFKPTMPPGPPPVPGFADSTRPHGHI